MRKFASNGQNVSRKGAFYGVSNFTVYIDPRADSQGLFTIGSFFGGINAVVINVSCVGVSYGVNPSLGKIAIGSVVSDIADRAFYKCYNLTNVSFESKKHLKSIGHYSFFKTGLNHLDVPNSVTTVGRRAFAMCVDLYSVNFTSHSTLNTFSEGLFYSSGINSLVIPTSVTLIEANALGMCTRLQSIYFTSNVNFSISTKPQSL